MQNSHALETVTSNDSVASVDIGDYQFCVRHGNEACKECEVDFKEVSSTFFYFLNLRH
jgi:hypothetical protein